MRRRVITKLLGGAMAWPLIAEAQQPALPTIGFLHSGSAEQNVRRLAAFRKGLGTAGFVEGRNVAIESRWAEGQYDRLADMAADLVALKAAVIVTLSSTPAALAAKKATGTVPIYFLIAESPAELGLVASLSRPGGNATGIITLAAELMPKRLELLREMTPQATILSALVNPDHPSAKATATTVGEMAARFGMQPQVLEAVSDAEIDAAFAALKAGTALLIGTDPTLFARRAKIAALTVKHAVPTMFDNRESVMAGGLMSYGANIERLWERAGVNVGRILKGEKPSSLPVEQAAEFSLALNLTTAKALGLAVPPKLLAMADDAIE